MTNEKVQRARSKKDKTHKKRNRFLPYLPTYLIQIGTFLASYLVNKLSISLDMVGFKSRDFGNVVMSNVGVFGMKRGFSPLVEITGCSILVAMGKVEKRAVVRNNEIVIRSMMNFNFTYDNRHAPLQSLAPCFEQIKDFFSHPQAYY